MIYRTLIICISSLLPFGISYAHAHKKVQTKEPGFYAGATLGYAEPTSFKNNARLRNEHGSANYGVLVGAHLQDWLRTGIEVTHRHKQKISGDITSNTIGTLSLSDTTTFLNGYFMIPQKGPYLLAGLGVASQKFGDFKDETGVLNKGKTTSNFAYQVGVGFTTDYKCMSFDAEAKYADKGKAKTRADDSGRIIKADTKDLILSISVRHNF